MAKPNRNTIYSDLLVGVNNIMLDLETLGKGSNAAIISIGAVRFDTAVRDRFYAVVDLQSSLDAGLEMDASTVMWWMQQSDEARSQFNRPTISLSQALLNFSIWASINAVVWGNGATFDNVILSNAYELCGINRPWDYRSDRCYRTVRAMREDIKAVYGGVYHNAVDDAENQARHLIRILSESFS